MATLTRIAIIKAFGEMAAVRPVDKITVKDITDYCGISRNTFYYHFKDIYQVLDEFLVYQHQNIIQWIDEHVDSDDFEEECRQGLNFLVGKRQLFFNLANSSNGEKVRKYMDDASTEVVYRAISRLSQGIDADEKDMELISRYCKFGLFGFMVDWLRDETGTPVMDVAKRLQLLFDGTILEALKRSERFKQEANSKN